MIISSEQSIQTFFWKVAWPTTTILVGVHGNERSWPLAMQELLDTWYTIDAWTVHIIFANIEALAQWKRYIEVNMNRCFWTQCVWYEAQRVKEILPYLRASDYLLDIHNTIDLSTPPFIICEHDDLLPYFDVAWAVRWLDDLHPGWSDGYMNSLWKKAVCLEVGSIVDDLEVTISLAKKHIENFLSAVGNKKQKATTYMIPSVMSCRSIYHAKFGSFVLQKKFSEFEYIRWWTVLWTDWGIDILMIEDGYMLFSRNTLEVGDECFVILHAK